jgi:hypothetical protein
MGKQWRTPAVWITTVAAGTHDRSMTSTLTQGNAAVFAGASMALAGIRLGRPWSFQQRRVGKRPVQRCPLLLVEGPWQRAESGGGGWQDRRLRPGVSDRVNKSLAVLEAGGIGMVLLNTLPVNSLNATCIRSRRIPSTPLALPCITMWARRCHRRD